MRYVSPLSAEEASNHLFSENGVSRVLAGGTDVLVQMKSGIVEPDLIVDIKKIKEIYKLYFNSGLNRKKALETIEADINRSKYKEEILKFIRSSKRGII